MVIQSNQYYSNPFLEEWNALYPGQEFPRPETYPHMYPEGSQTTQVVDDIYWWSGECSDASLCPRGVLDYKCQVQHSCWFALAEMAAYVIAILLVISILVTVLGKATSVVHALLTGVAVMEKVAGLIGGLFKCLTFGKFEQEVVVRVDEGKCKKMKKKNLDIAKRLRRIDLQIDFETLGDFHIQQVEDILEDYEISGLTKTPPQTPPRPNEQIA